MEGVASVDKLLFATSVARFIGVPNLENDPQYTSHYEQIIRLATL